jgi:hypothetical protein
VTLNNAIARTRNAAALPARAIATVRETASTVIAWRDGIGLRVESTARDTTAFAFLKVQQGIAGTVETGRTVIAWRDGIGRGVEQAAGRATAGMTGFARETGGFTALQAKRVFTGATDLIARGVVTTREMIAGMRSPRFVTPREIALRQRSRSGPRTAGQAEKGAAPAIKQQKYRTALTRRNGTLLIASLNLSIMDTLGNPYRQTPVVLFSTPKIAMTNDEGIATFHDVETGRHQIEIHVKEGQIEKKEIILEPPSGLTVEEQQRLDVMLPVVNVVVNEPLHGGTLNVAGLPVLAWVIGLLVVLGNAILGFLLLRRNHHHNHTS